jgi:hypothetical protein
MFSIVPLAFIHCSRLEQLLRATSSGPPPANETRIPLSETCFPTLVTSRSRLSAPRHLNE